VVTITESGEMDRPNELLEDVFADSPNRPTPGNLGKKRRKTRVVKLTRDSIKRRAFRVLAVVSDLDQPARKRVLTMAAKLSEV
jgi:hypothetical protein